MKSNDPTHIKLRMLRKAANKDQKEIASLLGIKQSYLSKIESGHLPMHETYLIKFCRVFNIELYNFYSSESIDLVSYFYYKTRGKILDNSNRLDAIK